MNVASPLAQQSWIFGHRASWQTVCNVLSFTAALVLLKIACCSPDGSVVRNQLGSLSRFGFGRRAGGVLLAIGSCLPGILAPPYFTPRFAYQKGVLWAFFLLALHKVLFGASFEYGFY
tara:strand:+ start:1582 stop:1935 length:354 start_codon:yes stop_codon:yes gene_type:complete